MFVLVDKPKGITSHDVVGRLRNITGERRIGHAGTLDPNASGLLIMGVGRASTKRLAHFLKLDKEYVAEIYLGEERDTDDIEGKIRHNRIQNVNEIPKSEIEKEIQKFFGKQLQKPPDFSAVKINGKKAYEMARKGTKPEIKPRKIVIYKIKVIDYKFPILKIQVKVSSGTYVRSLARDLGRKLGCGAYLSNLRRTQIGNYRVENSVALGKLNRDNIEDYDFDI